MQIRVDGAGINIQEFKWVKNAWGCMMKIQKGFVQEISLASSWQSGRCHIVRGEQGGHSEQGVA